MATQTKSTAAPSNPKRNLAPTPFKIIANTIPVDRFHSKLNRNGRTYYHDMLKALAAAKKGSVICLESAKPYPQIVKAAAKLGYEVHYAEDGGKLYIQLLSQGADN
jgi:hypothetical protein